MKRRNYSFVPNNNTFLIKPNRNNKDKEKIHLKKERSNMSTWFETNDNTTTNLAMSKTSKLSQLKTQTNNHKESQSIKPITNKKKQIRNVIDDTIKSLKLLRKVLISNMTDKKITLTYKSKPKTRSKSNHVKTITKKYDVNKSIEIDPIYLRLYKKLYHRDQPKNQCNTTPNTIYNTNTNSNCHNNTIIIRTGYTYFNQNIIHRQRNISFLSANSSIPPLSKIKFEMEKNNNQKIHMKLSNTLSFKSTQYTSPKCFTALPLKKQETIPEEQSSPFQVMLNNFDNALASIVIDDEEEETFEHSSNVSSLSYHWDESSQIEEMSDFIL